MRSAIAVTYEMDDMVLAAEELVYEIRQKLSFKKNTFAFLLCDSAIDCNALSAELRDRLGCDVIGSTTLASFNNKIGYNDMGITLTVMSADDASFSASVSGLVTPANFKDEIEHAYNSACKKLDCRPELIFIFPPTNSAISQDEYTELLSRLSGGVPVFGGCPSSSSEGKVDCFLFEDKSYDDRLGIMLIGGNIRPVFSVKSLEGKMFSVTKSEGNVIYTVDGEGFINFLNTCGLPVKNLRFNDDMYFATANPIVLKVFNDGGFALTRVLFEVNQDGSGSTYIKIPEGSRISAALLRRKDIELSSGSAIEEIISRIEENSHDGYEYSTVFCVSCMTRNSILANMYDMESRLLLEGIPESLNLTGFYARGEFAPVTGSNGESDNYAHNFSIAICAF